MDRRRSVVWRIGFVEAAVGLRSSRYSCAIVCGNNNIGRRGYAEDGDNKFGPMIMKVRAV